MAEWSKAAVLKTVERKFRGFESYLLRQFYFCFIGAGPLCGINPGEVSEWPKEHAWKACVLSRYRGFESLPLRHLIVPGTDLFVFTACDYFYTVIVLLKYWFECGEVSERPKERAC